MAPISFNPLVFSGLDLTGAGGPAGAVQWKEPVADEASLPLVGNIDGDARVTLDTDKIYVWDETSSRWVDTTVTVAAFGAVPNSNGITIAQDDSTANIRHTTINLEPADESNPGAVSTAAQSFAGFKTFIDPITIEAPTDQLVLGSGPTTTLSAPDPANDVIVTIPDVGVDSDIVLTQGNQTVNDTKTFSSTVITNAGIDVEGGPLFTTLGIGGTNADVINIGRSGATVNVVGTTFNQQVTNVNVTDKNITVNSGGPAGSGATAGIDVEENGSITGYVEVDVTRNSWLLKAPNTAGIATVTPGTSGIVLDQSSHDPVSLGPVGSSPNVNAASIIGSQQIVLEPADATHPGVLTAGTQTIGGNKTFSGTISASNLSGTNTGDVTLTAVGNSPNSNAASLLGQQLTIQPADATNPGVITSGTQTIGGAKTFNTAITGEVNYTPAVPANWSVPNPTLVSSALDSVAASVISTATQTETNLLAVIQAQNDLQKEPTGFVNLTDSSISFNDATRTFTIQPSSISFDVYIKGHKYTKSSAETVVIPNSSGTHYFYYDINGLLSTTQVFTSGLITDNAFVSNIYWNTDTSTHTYFAEERHGLIMDGATHSYLHTVLGSRFISGLALQNFSADGTGNVSADAQFTSDSGSIRDEDLLFQLAAQSQIAILYRQGQLWRKKSADSFPLIYSGTAGYTGASGLIPYNQYTGGAWQLTEIANTRFVLVHFFATNDIETPVIGIQGINEYTDVTSARNGANSEITSLAGLPFAEFVPIGSVVFQTASSYSNTPKARVRTVNGGNYVDFRGTQLYTPAGTATTHGLLSGLSSDDHIQYLLTDGTRALSGDFNANSHKLINVADGTSTADAVNLGQLNSVTNGNAQDISKTAFTAIDNTSSPADVTALVFSNVSTTGFYAQITVSRGSTYAQYAVNGVQKAASWELIQEYVGDDTGITFSITSLGQLQYTTTSTGTNASLLFRAQTV